MFDHRKLTSDLTALGLFVVLIFLSLSLATYDPADPIADHIAWLGDSFSPDGVVYPLNTHISNACGRWGAVTADLLFRGLGWGAVYLLVSLAVLDYFLLRRHTIDTPVIRTIGWVGSLVGTTAIVSIVLPGTSPGPVIGSGGYLGKLIEGMLEMHFATAGSLILSVSLVAGGLLLCTDYVLLQLAARLARVTLVAMAKALGIMPKRSRRRSDVETEASGQTDETDGVVSIRIHSRQATDDEDDASEMEEPEAAADETTDEQPQEETLVIKRRRGGGESERESSPKLRKKLNQRERERVMDSLNQATLGDGAFEYDLPGVDMLLPSDDFCFDEQEKEVRRKAKVLEKTFADFGFRVKVVEIETGPVIAQYEVELEAGLRLSRITGLADDLAIALRVPSVRIVAPIPGKNTVGIEVPNEQRQVVRLRDVIEESTDKTRKMRIPLFLGKDVSGNPLVVDLSTLPHLLIAGRTGTGKSVCLNAIISSILMTRRPDEVRMLMIDPKMVELSGYGRLPHLMHPVVTDMRKAEAILAWAVDKMEERYSLLARAGVRHISSYNQLDEDELMNRLQPETDEERDSIPLHLPFIVIVADEMADLMMTAGKEVEQHIIRLAQKSRAVGIHLILATQKPTVDVITGLIKSNLPARISFQVASRTDSRVVLDEMGADKLLGNGDMLFLWPGTSSLLRGQGTYLDDEEIERVVECVSTDEQNFVHELVNLQLEEEADTPPNALEKRDELYEGAVDVVVREGRGSVSLLQRTLGIGYGRAARLIDFMAEDGIVGAYAGSQAREVLISVSDWERMQNGSEAEPEPKSPQRESRRSRKVSLREDEEAHDESFAEDDLSLFEDEVDDYEEDPSSGYVSRLSR